MKRSYEVLWTATAENDLLGIILYIVDDSSDGAVKILARIQSRSARLNKSLLRGRVVPELLRQGVSNYRELVIDPWRVICKVEGDTVFVLSVVDSRRNVEDLLLTRLIR